MHDNRRKRAFSRGAPAGVSLMTPPKPYLQDADVTLYAGDAVDVLSGLPDGSVDCVATSPPFYGLRDYGVEGQIGLEATPDEWASRLVAVFAECRRVLSSTGTLFVECGDSYATHRNDNGWPENEGRTSFKGSVIPLGTKPKDLIGSPWLLAFALRADGWWLRQAIIWHKPNAMPESAKDRCTTAHSFVFLLAKQARYFFDADAIAEPAAWERWGDQTVPKHEGTDTAAGWIGPKSKRELVNRVPDGNGRFSDHRLRDDPGVKSMGGRPDRADGLKNPRSVWTIPTQGYPDAHFATWPEALARRIILAGCPEWVCRECGKPRERIVTRRPNPAGISGGEHREPGRDGGIAKGRPRDYDAERSIGSGEFIGWTDCSCSLAQVMSAQDGHSSSQPSPNSENFSPHVRQVSTGGKYRPGVVLDPFCGSGTTNLVARKHNRRSIGIDLNPAYLDLAAVRLQQQSLFAQETA